MQKPYYAFMTHGEYKPFPLVNMPHMLWGADRFELEARGPQKFQINEVHEAAKNSVCRKIKSKNQCSTEGG